MVGMCWVTIIIIATIIIIREWENCAIPAPLLVQRAKKV